MRKYGKSKKSENSMWQTKYASEVIKNLGVGVDFWPGNEGDFLSVFSQYILKTIMLKFCNSK